MKKTGEFRKEPHIEVIEENIVSIPVVSLLEKSINPTKIMQNANIKVQNDNLKFKKN